jgi:hypothetical protein
LALVVSGLLLTAGCASPFGGGDPDGLAEAAPPTCLVELNPLIGKPRQVSLVLQEGMTVQSALEQTKAHRKYGSMELVLVRQPATPGSEPQRLGATWEPKQRRVSIDTDYALYPGDVLVVNQLARKSVGELMLGEIAGPLVR